MSERLESLKVLAEVAFGRLDRGMEGLTEEELDWKSCEEANTIRWMLTHLAYEWNIFLPRFLGREVEAWPESYVGDPSLTLERIQRDLDKGRAIFDKGLKSLTPEVLKEEIQFFSRRTTREYALMQVLAEVIHHGGQLAHARGCMKRQRGGD